MPEGPPLKIVAARDGRKDQTVGVLHDKGVLVRPLYSPGWGKRLASDKLHSHRSPAAEEQNENLARMSMRG
jgi:hypothetical protein